MTGDGRHRARVYVVDDDASVRDGLTALLQAADREVKAFSDFESFVQHRRHDPTPAVLLLDVRLGRRNGLEHYEALRAEGLSLPVIFMTAYADLPTAVKALRLAATDFLEKPYGKTELFAAIDRAEATLTSATKDGCIADVADVSERYRSLSPREAEVFTAMAAGETTKAIARRLGISPRTVEVHRSRVMHKMATDSLATLVRMAVALQLPTEPRSS